jgi:DNA-binding transcriptional LysR family regulator
MAAAGEGVTFAPHMAAQAREYPGLRFLAFKAPVPTRDIAIAWRLSTPLDRAHQLVLDILEAAVQNVTKINALS